MSRKHSEGLSANREQFKFGITPHLLWRTSHSLLQTVQYIVSRVERNGDTIHGYA